MQRCLVVTFGEVPVLHRGGSASIRILYTYITSSGDIRYDNRSYAVVAQRKSCARWQISAPSVPSCVHANDLSFKKRVFRVVKGPHSCRDRCCCSRWYISNSLILKNVISKIYHQPLLDCFSPGIGIKNPQFSGIKLFQRISQFLMELDKVVFYHPYFSLFILMNY